jgi:hypothetical protein
LSLSLIVSPRTNTLHFDLNSCLEKKVHGDERVLLYILTIIQLNLYVQSSQYNRSWRV